MKEFKTQLFATTETGEKKLVGFVEWSIADEAKDVDVVMAIIDVEEQLVKSLLVFETSEKKE